MAVCLKKREKTHTHTCTHDICRLNFGNERVKPVLLAQNFPLMSTNLKLQTYVRSAEGSTSSLTSQTSKIEDYDGQKWVDDGKTMRLSL